MWTLRATSVHKKDTTVDTCRHPRTQRATQPHAVTASFIHSSIHSVSQSVRQSVSQSVIHSFFIHSLIHSFTTSILILVLITVIAGDVVLRVGSEAGWLEEEERVAPRTDTHAKLIVWMAALAGWPSQPIRTVWIAVRQYLKAVGIVVFVCGLGRVDC